MRASTLASFGCTVMFAAMVSAAPAGLVAVDTCAPTTTTVFVTLEPSTITIHDAPASTVYAADGQTPTIPDPTLLSTPLATDVDHNKPATADLSDPEIVTVTNTVVVTAQYTPPVSSSAYVISYYVSGTSTVYLNGPGPDASESISYAGPETVTIEPVEPSAGPRTTTLSGKTTIRVTQYRTVTGTLSVPKESSPGTNPSFSGIGAGGWNGTASGAYSTGTGLAGVYPTAQVTGAASRTTTIFPTSLSAKDGFGASDPGTLSIADPTFDFSKTFPSISLSTMAAKSGFDAFSTPTYVDGTPTAQHSSPTPLATQSTQSNVTFIAASSAVSSSTAILVSNSSIALQTTVIGSTPTTLASISQVTSTSSSSIGYNQTSTSVASSASPSTSACGEIGDFTLNFDDIPGLAASDDADPQPVFSPYHQFVFSNGYVVVPPPKDPYLPSSPPQLTEFIPNFTVKNSTAASGPNSAEGGFSADIGNGDHDHTGCFRFNFYGGSVGCDSQGPSCVFTFTGLRHDAAAGKDVAVASQILAVDACPELVDCTLTPVTLGQSFSDLTILRMQLSVGGEPKIWWMDDIRMGWYDNSCAMGMCRTTTHLHRRQIKSNISKLHR